MGRGRIPAGVESSYLSSGSDTRQEQQQVSIPDRRPDVTVDDLEIRVLMTTVEFAVPPGRPRPRRVSFIWRTLNPYVVDVQLDTGDREHPAPVWVLPRELLADRVAHCADQGDIRLQDLGSIRIQLTGSAGYLWVDVRELEVFLRDTFAWVPLGQERMWISLDAELAALLQTP
jgi:hypothetical protein